ncbi:glutathione peroxidase [Pontiella sp.]|uniref:glutathione peroxidase n=1 Tax=Pontiella sp. TaxID=2837462 RepID=UPI003565768A
MKTTILFTTLSALILTGCSFPSTAKEVPVKKLYDIEAKTIDGQTIKLEQYKGKTLLIVNTASKCGFTGQYEGLQKLYESYQDKGFVVLGFPSNDFLKQEPGTNEEIASFCQLNYGVTFPMFEKISVKGDGQHPLYAFLTDKKTNPGFDGKISWNFNKFLVSPEGKVVGRFGSRTKPSDKQLVEAIELLLK